MLIVWALNSDLDTRGLRCDTWASCGSIVSFNLHRESIQSSDQYVFFNMSSALLGLTLILIQLLVQ